MLEETQLLCSRCRVHFRTRDGFANLIPEEAVLPEGCAALNNSPAAAKDSHFLRALS